MDMLLLSTGLKRITLLLCVELSLDTLLLSTGLKGIILLLCAELSLDILLLSTELNSDILLLCTRYEFCKHYSSIPSYHFIPLSSKYHCSTSYPGI